ncbi:MAG: ABC transporter ATP-binding protein [Saccharospirillum sp.]|nr:ABC transporter ATP-binding protein [Saccharospirillum sp.]
MKQPLISIRNLCVDYVTGDQFFRAVKDVSLDIAESEILGLAGESGCGKSTLAFSLLNLHQPPAYITQGQILFQNDDILKWPLNQLNRFRWSQVGMVFQSAMNSLNPVARIDKQFLDVLARHTTMSKDQAISRAEEMMALVDIPLSRLYDYPHQCSGGMRQRIVIAICLALSPRLIIMDEPTTALDVVVQREILQQIHELKQKLDFSVLFITHDLALMLQFCDRIGIMKDGEIVELKDRATLYEKPEHSYTRQLLEAIPGRHLFGRTWHEPLPEVSP